MHVCVYIFIILILGQPFGENLNMRENAIHTHASNSHCEMKHTAVQMQYKYNYCKANGAVMS